MKPANIIGIRGAYMYRHRPRCLRMLADYSWRMLLSVAFVIVAISLSFGMYELSLVIDGDENVMQSISTSSWSKLSRTQLQSTVNTFSEREAKFNSLGASGQKLPDPSR